jgi:predicted neuraminidase
LARPAEAPPRPGRYNHAAFLQWLPDGTRACAWFGGTLEGAPTSLSFSRHALARRNLSAADRVSDDFDMSEQNCDLL